MTYVQGFVCAVPAKNKDAYIAQAKLAASLIQEFGAKRTVEAWGDDVPKGKVTDFQGAVQAKDNEIVVFAWQEFADKNASAAAHDAMVKDPRCEELMTNMSFDGQRMIYGGFEVLVDTGEQSSPGYVDGSVIAVPSSNKEAYLKLAPLQAQVLIDHGALRVVDAWGDFVPAGKVTDYQRAVKATESEDIVYMWVEWPSKEVRDQAWPKVFSDARMHGDASLYDEQRRVFGGFAPILEVGSAAS